MDTPVAKRRIPASLFWLAPGLLFSAYLAARRAGIALLYRPISLAEGQVRRDLCYVEGSEDPKHRLDLFLPPGSNRPILIFIHGGGLASGDKALRVSGADVYGNIGRFYAAHGIGVAVINYRLQPDVTWREQVEDVARAIAWVHSHAGSFGGDLSQLFVGGHSAGAHLAARVALDPGPLTRLGLSPEVLRGVIAVSGAGYDLNDAKTYEFGARPCHYEERFRGDDPTGSWKKEASPVTYASTGAPPFLILYPQGESKALRRQSQLLHETLQKKQIPSELMVVPGESHRRIVLTLSRTDKPSAAAILRFMAR